MKLANPDTASPQLHRNLTLELVRVTERAAIASAAWRGKGDEKSADHAAVEAMRTELVNVGIDGRIVIGEGERDEAPMLFIGESVGSGQGPAVDIAVDPLEGTTLCAKNQPDSICVLAMAERGGLLNAPDVYMQKIAIGAGYPEGTVDLDMSPRENIASLAKAKGVAVEEVTFKGDHWAVRTSAGPHHRPPGPSPRQQRTQGSRSAAARAADKARRAVPRPARAADRRSICIRPCRSRAGP